jgi:hypothetical protein
MNWRMATSLEVLRKQLNALYPNRSTVSDGGIGNAEHSARTSDHNPNSKGDVCARDFTHDPANGLDCNELASKLVAARDSRIKYLIWNRQICSSTTSAWKWRLYTGSNAHTKHLHISVHGDYDNPREWDLNGVGFKPAPHLPEIVEFGDRGFNVKKVQELLVKKGFLKESQVDTIFGNNTALAVKNFQKANGLDADGIVGNDTWEKLEAK